MFDSGAFGFGLKNAVILDAMLQSSCCDCLLVDAVDAVILQSKR